MKKIVVVAAMEEELLPLIRKFDSSVDKIRKKEVREYVCNGNQLYLIRSGVGARNMKKIEDKLDALAPFDMIICIGTCGAIDDASVTSDIVIPDRVYSEDGACCLLSASNELKTMWQKSHMFIDGSMISTSTVARKEKKIALHEVNPDIVAVDMEAFAFSEIVKQKGYRGAVIKVVSDSRQSILPDEQILARYFSANKPLILLKACIVHPIEMMRLFRLKKTFYGVCNMLAQCIESMLTNYGM